MNFTIPADGSLFEIPDSWLALAGVEKACTAKQRHYIHTDVPEQDILLVPVKVIAPPHRIPGLIGLDQAKVVAILRAMSSGQPLPPIEVNKLPPRDYFSYRILDGFHRYHVAIAMEMSTIPVICKPAFDMSYPLSI